MSRRALLLYLVITAAATAPFLALRHPPLQDYPNTLARARILMSMEEPGSPFPEDFRVVSRLVPDMATDLVLPPLASLVGLEWAGRLFLAFSVGLLPIGVLLLVRAFFPTRPLLAFWLLPLTHNWYVMMGFLNYMLGVGLSLLALALWLLWSRRWTALRLVSFAAVATLVYAVHLFALGALGLSVLVLSLVERKPWRARLLDVLPFVPIVILFAGFRRTEGLPGLEISYELYQEKLLVFLNLLVMFSYGDGVIVGALLGLGWLWLRRGGGLRPDRRAGALVLAFAVTYLVLPKMLFGVFYTDERILVYLAVAVVLAWPLSESRMRTGAVVAGSIAVIALGLSTIRMIRLDREISEETALIERLEPARRLLPVEHRPCVGRVDVWHHVACWYTVRRHGTSAYVFATPGKHVLRWRRTLRSPHEYFMRHPDHEPLDMEAIADEFDYVWKFGVGAPSRERLEPVAVRVARTARSEVWKIVDERR